MSAARWEGQRFRTFNVMDDFNRDAVALAIDRNLPAIRLIRILERIAASRSLPQPLRLDCGPKFVWLTKTNRADPRSVEPGLIQPEKPLQTVLTGHSDGIKLRGVPAPHSSRR